jgi:cysteinyl-tRNA synthetase
MSMMSMIAKAAPFSIYTLLSGEHKEVNALLALLEASPDNLETGRGALFNKFKHELLSHAKAEEETVYDVLKTRQAEKGLVSHAKREHEEVELLLVELESMDLNDPSWGLKLQELKTKLNHHVEEEEEKMFSDMREIFSSEDAVTMGKSFRDRKNQLLKDFKDADKEETTDVYAS